MEPKNLNNELHPIINLFLTSFQMCNGHVSMFIFSANFFETLFVEQGLQIWLAHFCKQCNALGEHNQINRPTSIYTLKAHALEVWLLDF
jgi:hypothetical protein